MIPPLYGVRVTATQLKQGDTQLWAAWCNSGWLEEKVVLIAIPDATWASHDLNAAHRFAEHMRRAHPFYHYQVEERA